MKRFAAIFLAAVCTLSLTACGSQKPSLDEVETAIAEGDVTVEYALEKGWVTQEWADEYRAQNAVPAGNKLEAGMIGDFTTTTVSGDSFTKDQMEDITYFAFLDPTTPEAETFYQALVDGYDGVKENGAEILVCVKNDAESELFAEAPFTVINYNDSLKAATETYTDMIEGLPNSASWCVNGAFYSAWASAVDAEGLAGSASAYVEMKQEIDSDAGSGADKAVIMG